MCSRERLGERLGGADLLPSLGEASVRALRPSVGVRGSREPFRVGGAVLSHSLVRSSSLVVLLSVQCVFAGKRQRKYSQVSRTLKTLLLNLRSVYMRQP